MMQFQPAWRSHLIKRSWLQIGLFLLLVNGSVSLRAQVSEVFEASVDAKVTSRHRAEAEKQVYAQAVREVTLGKIQEMIGEEKTAKSKAVIERKILQESGKYVSYMKGGKLSFDGKQYSMPITLRLSLENLRALLSEEGLLYKKDGLPKVLPVIGLVDRIHGQSYQWWMGGRQGDKAFLRRQSQVLHGSLQQAFWKNGFYVYRPMGGDVDTVIPSAYQQESYRSGDYQLLGEFFQAQVVVQGDVRLLSSPRLAEAVRVSARLTAVHAGTGRVIGEVTRDFETESGHFEEVVGGKLGEAFSSMSEDLAVQVLQTWQRGVLGANLLNMAFRGNLGPTHLEKLKGELVLKVSAIKTVRERLFEPGQVVLEVDSSEDLKQLANTLRRVSLPGFSLKVGEYSEAKNTLYLDIQ